MKQIKHFISILVVCTFAAAIICGCGSKEKQTADTPVSQAPTELPSASTDANAPAESDLTIKVSCEYKDGSPVEGAVIQFCDDSCCSRATTDNQGLATLAIEKSGSFDITLAKAPEGYSVEGDSTVKCYADITKLAEVLHSFVLVEE